MRTSILLFTLTRSPFLQIHCSWRGNIRIEILKNGYICDSSGVLWIAKNAVLAPSHHEATQTLWIQPRRCESNPWDRAELTSLSFFGNSLQKHTFIILPLTYSLIFSIYRASRLNILKTNSTIYFKTRYSCLVSSTARQTPWAMNLSSCLNWRRATSDSFPPTCSQHSRNVRWDISCGGPGCVWLTSHRENTYKQFVLWCLQTYLETKCVTHHQVHTDTSFTQRVLVACMQVPSGEKAWSLKEEGCASDARLHPHANASDASIWADLTIVLVGRCRKRFSKAVRVVSGVSGVSGVLSLVRSVTQLVQSDCITEQV